MNSRKKHSTVYMSYDGMLEPLGESQVVAYLENLANDYDIHLISFEKADDLLKLNRKSLMTERLTRSGIKWYPRQYHKHPKIISTLWDMLGAILLSIRITVINKAVILHSRSILCAAMLYPAKLIGGAYSLVDIRGFWADERVDGGLISAGGPVYRVLKAIEKVMLRRADHIVTLTHASVPFIRNDPRLGRTTAPITVIPTCADLSLFSPGERDVTAPLTIGYAGQIGTWYMLDEMLAFFAAVQRHRPEARMLIVNHHQNQRTAIRRAINLVKIDPAAVTIVGAHRSGMPGYIRQMDAGLAFIRPCFSKLASAPTKFAEYLGCGVPVVGNAGCGDMVRIIEEDRVGVAMADVGPAEIDAAALQLLDRLGDPALASRCVVSARQHFSLADGVASYRAIYRSLIDAGS